MAQNTYKPNSFKSNGRKKKSPERSLTKSINILFLKDRRLQLSLGFLLLLASAFILLSCLSYLSTGKADQSVVEAFFDENETVKALGQEAANWMKLLGALVSHKLIFLWFGLSAFLIPPQLFLLGYRMVWQKSLLPLPRSIAFSFFFLVWISLFMGSIAIGNAVSEWSFYCGGWGYQLAVFLHSLLGYGNILFLAFTLLVFVVFFFNVTDLLFLKKAFSNIFSGEEQANKDTEEMTSPEFSETHSEHEAEDDLDEVKETETRIVSLHEEDPGLIVETVESVPELEIIPGIATEKTRTDEPDFEVEINDKAEKLVEKAGHYDPTLDLAEFRFPGIEMLKEYSTGKISVNKEELEDNKDKIVETLTNFKIGISSIKATIGPTVTLYEIVPDAGIKISKIKNLEDDIALSLAALGIRIIAPIPGKGTIGIEVPNKNKEMVGMRSVLATDQFMNADKALPVVLGKTISNEVFVTDLSKMPHLLMAGATGQGKSVGLNVILTSLLYKKHPSQLKFVLVDPKKVELTLFNKIERHYLAKLPDSEEAIITDTQKVIHTLNSLCIEMDQRYDLLKEAACRNIKEYNQKYIHRRLNPEKGHRYLPYIVLVIDELADLMMTAGKEVETPIARLAQLARAIGIHLVIATQRPSVNVITGVIKANFPARLSFRVTSKVDSRTILDAGGADQLIGQGDMLLSMGSDIIRLQCAFVDTPEVDEICDFIGSQRGYDSAYLLPEFSGDEGEGGKGDIDLSDRDALFEEAARLIVAHQQGSTSLIQRKLKLGYNRAGRLMDQLEAAGVVGPFEGSKAREVLISDEYSLEQLLNDLD